MEGGNADREVVSEEDFRLNQEAANGLGAKGPSKHSSLRSILVYGLVLAVYCGLSALLTYPMILRMGRETPLFHNAIASIYLLAEQSYLFFVEHPLSLYGAFNPTIMWPMPYGMFQAGGSFLNSLIFGLFYIPTMDLYFAGNALLLFALSTSALGMFSMSRDILHDDRAAFLAGAVFVCTQANSVSYWDLLSTNYLFFFLTLKFFVRFLDHNKSRDMLLTGFLIAVQFYTYFYHLVILLHLLAFLALWRWRSFFKTRNLTPVAASALLSLALAMPLAWGFIKAFMLYDFNFSLSTLNQSYSIAPSPLEWFNVPGTNVLYGKLLAQPYLEQDASFTLALFPGVIFWALLLIGAVRWKSSSLSRYFLITLLLSVIILSTGWMPFHLIRQEPTFAVLLMILSKVLIGLKIVRVPTRLIFLFGLAGGLLAGHGYQVLAQTRTFARAGAGLLLVLLVGGICLENLNIPVKMFNWDRVMFPRPSEKWISQHRPNTSGQVLLHIPDLFLWPQPGNSLTIYPEWLVDLFPNHRLRIPTANGVYSYQPAGFTNPFAMQMPFPFAQKYWAAIGVNLVIVHEGQLTEEDKVRFGRENMEQCGMKILASFPDGDRIYALKQPIEMTKNLYLYPVIDEKEKVLKIQMLTPEYEQSRRLLKPLKIEDAVMFWRNPVVCARQRLGITVVDGKGATHEAEFSYSLPLVVGVNLITPVRWGLAENAGPPPWKVVTIKARENYLIQPPDQSGLWRLEND